MRALAQKIAAETTRGCSSRMSRPCESYCAGAPTACRKRLSATRAFALTIPVSSSFRKCLCKVLSVIGRFVSGLTIIWHISSWEMP